MLDEKKTQLIEKIKNLIVELVYSSEEPLKINLSNHISDKLHQNYHYLSNLFSEVEGRTIEHYFITLKIERVKELLVYGALSLSEISSAAMVWNSMAGNCLRAISIMEGL